PEMRVEPRERWSDFRPQPAKCSTKTNNLLQGSKTLSYLRRKPSFSAQQQSGVPTFMCYISSNE
ncbi:MAG: hypothetical protein ACLTAO_04420, partial [Christensenellales bacterium]